MALVRCPECNGLISDTSNTCVHCGYAITHGSHIVISGISFVLRVCGSITICVGNKEWGTLNRVTDSDVECAYVYSEEECILSIRASGCITARYHINKNEDKKLQLLKDKFSNRIQIVEE